MTPVIYLHILKCGGTSMLYMLYEQYGAGAFHPVPISTVKDVVEYPNLRGFTALSWQGMLQTDTIGFYGCIAGHYDWDIALRLPESRVVTFLRHPVQQLKSLYQYMAREVKEDRETALYLQGIGFAGWLASEHIQNYLNGQTTVLSGHRRRSLDLAMANLQSGRIVYGLVERYSESVALFNRAFDWSLREQKRNVAPNVIDLPDNIYQEALRLQATDMQLYDYACKHFEEQARWY